MQPIRPIPRHYLLTYGQRAGLEPFDPDGANAEPARAGLFGLGAASARTCAPAALEGLSFCTDGNRLTATRARDGGGRELHLLDLLCPDEPRQLTVAVDAPVRAAWASCAGGALDVHLGPDLLHWPAFGAPGACAASQTKYIAGRDFADWVASFGVRYDVDDAEEFALADLFVQPAPVWAEAAPDGWRAALVDTGLLYEHATPEGPRRLMREDLRSLGLGRPLALWFCGEALLWLTADADSARGRDGRTDLWRLPLRALAQDVHAKEEHVALLDRVGQEVVVGASGRFAAVFAQRHVGGPRPYVLDCRPAKSIFRPLRCGHDGVFVPGGAAAFAPEGNHLLCWSPERPGVPPVVFDLERALATPPRTAALRGRALAPFAADHGGAYALGPGGRSLAHAGSAPGAAVVVYDLAWPAGASATAQHAGCKEVAGR